MICEFCLSGSVLQKHYHSIKVSKIESILSTDPDRSLNPAPILTDLFLPGQGAAFDNSKLLFIVSGFFFFLSVLIIISTFVTTDLSVLVIRTGNKKNLITHLLGIDCVCLSVFVQFPHFKHRHSTERGQLNFVELTTV